MAYVIGPDFLEGGTRDLPSGATDLAPTILALLGIEPSAWVDGRVLWEAMRRPAGEPADMTGEEIVPSVVDATGFNPVIRLHRVGRTSYVHEVSNGRGAHDPGAA